MGIGTSVALIAVGAILKFAVTTTVSGISIPTVGVVLMVAGILGLVVTLFFLSSRNSRRDPVVRDRYEDPRL
jgi:ABC-type antimicrobial peptide transport system permease subunit